MFRLPSKSVCSSTDNLGMSFEVNVIVTTKAHQIAEGCSECLTHWHDHHNTGGHKKSQCPKVSGLASSRESHQSWSGEQSFWEMRFIYHSGLPLGSFTQQHRYSCNETYWGSWGPSPEYTRWLGGLLSREFFAKKGLWFKSIWNT